MPVRNNLNRILREKGITLDHLSEQLNIPIETLDEIYMNRKGFSPEILTVVSEFLNVPQETLLIDGRKNIYENMVFNSDKSERKKK